jgi:hypothetical protein
VLEAGSYNTVSKEEEEEEELDKLEEDTSKELEELEDTVTIPLPLISRLSCPIQITQQGVQLPQHPITTPTNHAQGSLILD